MLRAAQLPRSQPALLNLLLVSKRWQQTPASPGMGVTASTKSTPGSHTTQYATTNPPSSTTTQTASARPTFNAPVDRTNNPYKTTPPSQPSSYTPPPSSRTGSPPPFSAPPRKPTGSSTGTIVKAIAYSLALGLTATIFYAEYENGPFRRQLESTVPYSSTVLGGIDEFINPMLGRQKPLSTGVAEKFPDLSYVKDKVPDKDQIKKIGQQIKDKAGNVVDKVTEKTQKAGEQTKEAINQTYDKLTDQNKVKTTVNKATEQVNYPSS